MPLGTKSSDKLIKFELLILFLKAKLNIAEKKFFFFCLFSFLLTINLKLIIVHVEIKIVNKEAANKRSTLLHAQCQLCM